MKIEDVRAVLRPRSGWQAVDLGCLLWQRDLGSILLAWLPLSLALFAASITIGGGATAASALLFWWLFPLAGRGVLFVISRSLFGDQLRGWRALGAAFGFGWRDVFRTLLFARVSPMRTLVSPVTLLEGLGGAERRQRIAALDRSGGQVVGVALLSFWFVALGILAILALLHFFEQGPMPGGDSIDASPDRRLVFGAWFLGVSVFEPLHVAIGFATYLDGRSHVEGWDVELGLRTLAKRLEATSRSFGAFGLGVVLLLAPALGGVVQEEVDPTEVIERVLADPDFGGTEMRGNIVLRRDDEDFNANSGFGGLEGFGWLARLGLVVFYVLVAVLLGFLIYAIVRAVDGRGRRVPLPAKKPPRSIVEAALEGGDEALPADVREAARALFDQGRAAEAAGLVYRASLVALVDQHAVAIEPSDTESACVRRVRRTLGGDRAEAFRRVTHVWQRAAYASLRVESEELELALEDWEVLRAVAA